MEIVCRLELCWEFLSIVISNVHTTCESSSLTFKTKWNLRMQQSWITQSIKFCKTGPAELRGKGLVCWSDIVCKLVNAFIYKVLINFWCFKHQTPTIACSKLLRQKHIWNKNWRNYHQICGFFTISIILFQICIWANNHWVLVF